MGEGMVVRKDSRGSGLRINAPCAEKKQRQLKTNGRGVYSNEGKDEKPSNGLKKTA